MIGHDPILAGHKGKKSPFPDALKLSRQANHLSEFIKYFTTWRHEVREGHIKENFEAYKNDEQFNQVDAVMCSFPSSMCEAFIPLNKSIIFSPAHRYNIGRCNIESMNILNKNYDLLNYKSKLVVAATP